MPYISVYDMYNINQSKYPNIQIPKAHPFAACYSQPSINNLVNTDLLSRATSNTKSREKRIPPPILLHSPYYVPTGECEALKTALILLQHPITYKAGFDEPQDYATNCHSQIKSGTED